LAFDTVEVSWGVPGFFKYKFTRKVVRRR
jgi:hypothetical protein